MPSHRNKSSGHKSTVAKSAHTKANGTPAAHARPDGDRHKVGWFTWFAMATAHLTGRPVTFMLAALTIVVWAATGPIFHYSDTWQLVINTGTTIVTFLMVFLIQNTQNRDTMALQIKLAELIIAMHGAKNRLAAAEDLCDEDLQALHKEYHDRAEEIGTLAQRRAAARERQ